VQRFGIAVVALLALIAFAGAAGTFDAVDSPSIGSDETPTGQQTVTGPPPSAGTSDTDGSDLDRAPTESPVGASDGGGVSPLFVPAVVGSLLASGLFVVFLTGDDERAPEVPAADDSAADPVPTVEPNYERSGDGPVRRAWADLRERADGDETATPREVAAQALDGQLPVDPVATITDRFRAVRYGDEVPTDREIERTQSAASSLNDAEAPSDGNSAEGVASDGRQ